MKSLSILCVAVLLFGCAKEEDKVSASKDYIDFTVVTDVYHSRSEVVDNVRDLHDINIFAYQEGLESPFVSELIAHRDYRDWSYSPRADWADYNDEPTIFYAYSPQQTADNGLCVNSSARGLVLNYSTPAEASKHPYILVSYPNRHDENSVEPVRFVMQHPLSVVRFDVVDDLATEIIVSGVVVESQLTLSNNDLYEWGDALSLGEVHSAPGENMMLIPQTLGKEASVTVVYADRQEVYLLAGEEWVANKKVGYTIAADSLVLSSTQRRVLSL